MVSKTELKKLIMQNKKLQQQLSQRKKVEELKNRQLSLINENKRLIQKLKRPSKSAIVGRKVSKGLISFGKKAWDVSGKLADNYDAYEKRQAKINKLKKTTKKR